MRTTMMIAATTAMAVSLAGCNGDSFKGTAFESWDEAIEANNLVRASGEVRTASFNADDDGEVEVGDVQKENGNLIVGFDDDEQLDRISVTKTPANVSFNTANDDTIVQDGQYIRATSEDEDSLALFADPTAMGFNYQTFGVWATGLNGNSGKAAAGSFGAMTAVADMPNTGTATYDGEAVGLYVDRNADAADDVYLTRADMQAIADFADEEIAFSTSNTSAREFETGADAGFFDNLNMAGTLDIDGATFEGNVTAGDGLAGDASGRFYGPDAEEIGGTFSLTNDEDTYMGSFGGVRAAP